MYLPKGSIERLQKIQNQGARILTKTPRCDRISEVLVSLHWLRIEQRIIYKILVLTFKAFVDHSAPMYLPELVKKKSSSTKTRSVNDDILLVFLYRLLLLLIQIVTTVFYGLLLII